MLMTVERPVADLRLVLTKQLGSVDLYFNLFWINCSNLSLLHQYFVFFLGNLVEILVNKCSEVLVKFIIPSALFPKLKNWRELLRKKLNWG